MNRRGQYSQVPAAGHSVDEYLETIYFLAFPIGEYTPHGAGSPPLASRVAEMLHVSRASAGEMLKRLEADGLIERGKKKEALLTESGRERAERVVRKHRIIERLLTDFRAFPIGEYTPHGAGSPPLASRVAEMLHVSRASAGEMLKRLEADGLIERGKKKEALLTESGRERAERVVRKHRIIERLLTDFMGYTGYESHERADELGDTFSDEMIERIDDKLGHPQRCPHGWPVDPAVEQAENAELSPLATLPAGTRGTIVRLAEHDGDLLHWFYDQGLVPGTSILVRAAEPAADQFTVAIEKVGERAISEKAAAGLFVRPS